MKLIVNIYGNFSDYNESEIGIYCNTVLNPSFSKFSGSSVDFFFLQTNLKYQKYLVHY